MTIPNSTWADEPSLADPDSRNATVGALLAVLLLVAALAARAVLEIGWLLPAPIGDARFFVTVSANYGCAGFFGSDAFPIDPTGQSRMVWHGFVSPLLFGWATPGCSPRFLYALLWLLQACTTIAIGWLCRAKGYHWAATAGIAVFALAVQSSISFRPESLGLLLLVIAEIAVFRHAPLWLGLCLGTLLCTQPTLTALYVLVLICVRPELRRDWLRVGCGSLIAAGSLLAWYPFPLSDLAQGIQLQARSIAGRHDGDVFSYYITAHFLPLWGLLFAVMLGLSLWKRPLLLLAVIPLWYFGPRLAPLTYNLMPLCVLLFFVATDTQPRPVGLALGIATLVVGALGLTLQSGRDALTASTYGHTFEQTATMVAALQASGARIRQAEPFLDLTNPNLAVARHTAASDAREAGHRVVDIVAVSGKPVPPCARGEFPPAVSLGLGGRQLFNTNSGWQVYVCDIEP